MIRNKKIKHLGYCRDCLNEEFGMNLHRRDVLIYHFPGPCRKCLKTKNIVAKVKPAGAWKLIFGRRK